MNPIFIARVPHGMEWLAAAELEQAGGRVSLMAHRVLRFGFGELPARGVLAGLRSVDDVFLLMGEVAEVPRDKSALALLRGLKLDLDAAAALVRQYEPHDTRTFTVVASALGKRNYGRYEMEEALGSALARGRWRFEDSRLGHAGSERLSVRLHVEAGAFVALRVFEHPLHRRAYRTDTSVAALRPTVAAGLCLLADPRQGERLHDPFCGVGTIPIEAALGGSGVVASGSDIDAQRIESAVQNARRAGCDVDLRSADAGRLPFDAESLHAVVTNPPWEQKVELARRQRGRHWLHEISRVLRADGRLVLLVADPESAEQEASRHGWTLRARFQLSLFGSHPTVVGFTRSERRDGFFREDGEVGRLLSKHHGRAAGQPLRSS